MPDFDPHPDYRDFPDHPLHDVPASILETARAYLTRQAVVWNDVAEEAAVPLADAVVAEVLPGMKAWLVERPEDPDSLTNPDD